MSRCFIKNYELSIRRALCFLFVGVLLLLCLALAGCHRGRAYFPAERDDAEKMLHMLQGNTHSVYTGVTLIGKGKSVTFAEETKVTMYPVSHEEITWYIETKEPDDKAGSYAVQGLGARFIQKIEGDYNNVVGLPAGRIYQILRNWEE